MQKKYWFSIILATVVLLFGVKPLLAETDTSSAFEGDQAGASRSSLNLYGGYVEDFAIDTAGTVYAALNSANGIFTSTDRGETWHGPAAGTDVGTVADVEVSNTAGTAFIIGGIKLYKTTDSGSTWNVVTGSTGDSQSDNYGQAMIYKSGTLLVAKRDGSLDRSTDNGTTFSKITLSGSTGTISAFAAGTTNEFYLIISSGSDTTLYHSTDAGVTWSSATVTGVFSNVAVNPANTNVIVLSGSNNASYTTGGASGTWQAMILANGATASIAFTDSKLYIGSSWTTDYGAAWHNLASEATHYDTILKGNHVMIDPNDATYNTMYIDSGRGIARSDDAGANWYDKVEGLQGVTVNAIAQSADKTTVWLAAQGGLAKTTNFTDTAPTWQFPILPHTNVDFTTAVWVSPLDSNIVLAAGVSVLYRSTDGGSTWLNVASFANNGNATDIIANADASEINVSYQDTQSVSGGVLRSVDAGATWTELGLTAPVNALALSAGGTLYAGAGIEQSSVTTTRGIYVYNGSTWSQITGTENYLVNDLLTIGQNLYAAAGETSGGAVLRSSDGVTWEVLAGGLPTDGWFHALAADPYDSNAVYVSTARPAGTSYIYKSSDLGDTWNVYYTGLTDEKFNALLFDGLMSGTDTGVYAYLTKVAITLTTKTKKIVPGTATILKAKLVDAVDGSVLNKKTIRLYKRKSSGKWQYISKAKTKKTGKVEFTVKPTKKTVYQARWKAKSTVDLATYVASNASNNLTIKIKK
ncbi:MAG: hypothetical protein WCW27_06175 [Patescibacteria group bacterium]|jgi:hypothetical protein